MTWFDKIFKVKASKINVNSHYIRDNQYIMVDNLYTNFKYVIPINQSIWDLSEIDRSNQLYKWCEQHDSVFMYDRVIYDTYFKRFFSNELGGGDYYFIATNNEEEAVQNVLRWS